MPPMEPPAPITEQELLILYQDQLDNIRDVKANQWRISHYGVIAQAAYVAISKHLELAGGPLHFLIAMAVGTAVLVLLLDNHFQHRIAKRREALDILSKRPKETFDDVRERLRKERRCPPQMNRWSGEWHVFTPLLAVQVVSTAFAIWVMIS